MGPTSREIENRKEKRRTTSCNGSASRESCNDCHNDRWNWYGCGKATCTQPGCQKHHTNRRAGRAWSKLQAFESAPWGVVVLTMPGSVRDCLRDRETCAAVRKRAVEIVKAWAVRWGFHGVPVRLGGSVVLHPCGENPDIFAPHFNIVFPWVGETDDGAYRIGRFYFPEKDGTAQRAFDDLRQQWSIALVDLGWEATCSPQVDYEFRKSEGAKRHAARYFFRSFPAWAAWTQRVYWWGFLAHSLEAHEPPAWSQPPKPGRCDACGGFTRTVEIVAFRKWTLRDDAGVWHQQNGPPPIGKWSDLWHGL